MDSFFHKAYQLISQRRWLGLLLLLSIVLVLVDIITKIEFDDDISSLIPASEEAKKTQEILKSIAFTDKIIINIHRSPETSVEELTKYASDFLDSIQRTSGPYIKRVQGKLNDEDLPNTLNLVYENLPIFLDDVDYNTIAGKLSKDSISKITEQHYRTLISPSGIIASKTIRKDLMV